MTLLASLLAKREGREELLASAAPVAPVAIVIGGEKGGVGKTTTTELVSLNLQQAGFAHTVAECEAQARLARRLAVPVTHHPLHQETVRQLADDPDLLNLYWDRVCEQWRTGFTLVDLAANSVRLMLRWASSRAVREVLRGGAGLVFVLVTTADAASLSATLGSARELAHALPLAERWIVVNEVAGAVDLQHPGVRKLLAEAGCQGPLRLTQCPAPSFAVLRGLGGFGDAAQMSVQQLMPHGIPMLQAGRALEGPGDWLLDSCATLMPVTASSVPAGVRPA